MRTLNNINLFWYFWSLFVYACVLLAAYFGFVQDIIATDISRLAIVIFVIYLVSNVRLGIQLYRDDYVRPNDYFFIASVMRQLGLIGTLIGFIAVLQVLKVDASAFTTDDLAPTILKVFGGLATAIYTTLIGSIFALSMEIQMRILRH